MLLLATIAAQAQKPTGSDIVSSANCDEMVVPDYKYDINGPVSISPALNADIELKLYPNPVCSYLSVDIDCKYSGVPEPVYIFVYDMKGRMVLGMRDMIKPGYPFHKDIDVRGLPDDDYVFQLIKGNVKHVKKFQVYA